MNSSVARGGFALESCTVVVISMTAIITKQCCGFEYVVYFGTGSGIKYQLALPFLDPDPKHKNYIQNGKTTS